MTFNDVPPLFDDSGEPTNIPPRSPHHISVQPGDVLYVSRKKVRLERDESSNEDVEVIRAVDK